jgi:U3 small nucleolar RNA-associated protein 21
MGFLGASTITSLIHPATYINKFLVGFSDGRLELWNFNSRKLIYQYTSLVPYLTKSTATRGRKVRVGGLQLVELADSDDENDDAALSGGVSAYITCMESSPAMDVVAVGCSNGAILLLHLKLDQVMFAFQQSDGAVTSLSFRTDSESARYPFLVSSSPQGRIHIWNLGSRSSDPPPGVDEDYDDVTNPLPLERKLQCSVEDAHRGYISRVSFLPGEPIMVSAGHDNCLRMW